MTVEQLRQAYEAKRRAAAVAEEAYYVAHQAKWDAQMEAYRAEWAWRSAGGVSFPACRLEVKSDESVF